MGIFTKARSFIPIYFKLTLLIKAKIFKEKEIRPKFQIIDPLTWKMTHLKINLFIFTAKRILERLGIQTSSLFVKDRSVLLILKPISYFLGIYMAWFLI